MSNKSVIAIIVVIIVLAVAFFTLVPFGNPEENLITDENTDNQDVTPQVVRAEHFYEDGTHTLNGEVELPTPCHELDNTVTIAESFPEQVEILFTAESTADICSQVITSKVFSVSFEASEEAQIRASLNGNSLILDLVDAGAGSAIEKL